MKTVQNDSVLGKIKHTHDVETDEKMWQGSFAIAGFDQPVPFEFYGDEVDDPEQAFVLLRKFSSDSEPYLRNGASALRDFLRERGEVFGFSEDESANFLQLTENELRAILQEPLVKVLSDDEGDLLLLLSFHDCPLDGEGGVGIVFKDGLFSEITSAAGELGMYSN
jgi:hypothetical protein